jgi:CDP-paratose 2-epimerase
VLHIDDLCNLVLLQIKNFKDINNKLFTVGGSKKSYTSLKKLTNICEKITKNRLKFTKVSNTSIYDIPYYISDNRQVIKTYNWKPKHDIKKIVNDLFIWLKNNKSKIEKYF